jgi:membrane protein involved in colicin uptake
MLIAGLRSSTIMVALLLAPSNTLAQDTTGIVFTRGCSGIENADGTCIDDPTPEQKRQAEERQRRQRERDENDRRERDRKDAERKRQVDVYVKQMGPHRRAEAEQLVRMKEAADEARNKGRWTPEPCKRREMRMIADPQDGGKLKPVSVCLDGSRVIGQ